MKYDIVEPTKKSFEPFELRISIESANDLQYLAAALNLSPVNIRKQSHYLRNVEYHRSDAFIDLLIALDTLLETRNLKGE